MKENKKLECALEYLDRGWSVIPIKPEGKRPAIKWLEYQQRLPTEDEVTQWWTQWENYDIALVTGELSGVVVVDCDNDVAFRSSQEAKMSTPIQVKTKRGRHLYFEHPKDGIRRGPRAGVNSRGSDWPQINGLDFRGDGSYALLPPSKNYSWDYPLDVFDWDEMAIWKDWKPSLKERMNDGDFHFSKLDLTSVKPFDPNEMLSEWDRTARYVKEKYPSTLKMPSGMSNGRNERVMRYISECIINGYFGSELRVRGLAFMNEFFQDSLPEREFEATVSSMEQAEKRNHPDRFDEDGNFIGQPVTEEFKDRPRKLIQMKDCKVLEAEIYLPWRNEKCRVTGSDLLIVSEV